MAMLPQIRDLFMPSMYVAADAYRARHGKPIEWDMWVSHIPGSGIAMSSVADGKKREAFVEEREIDRAIEAGLKWSYRPMGGPRGWRHHSILKRCNERAIVQLMQKHIARVFPAPEAQ